MQLPCRWPGNIQRRQSSCCQVPFKYWTGTLVLDIHEKGSETPGRVEIELAGPEEGSEHLHRTSASSGIHGRVALKQAFFSHSEGLSQQPSVSHPAVRTTSLLPPGVSRPVVVRQACSTAARGCCLPIGPRLWQMQHPVAILPLLGKVALRRPQ